ncbi:MAG TPA: TetR/AcrR family transcriptional regulator [Gemmatimonadaceae bacterium]|jgi:AcrR family transcriptional regulator|nr:TetR/AcrR family transcriptional regulator [Gemmatimonadaceae bacterium]
MTVISAAAERRERDKLAVRTKILDAARELFVEHGFDAVTMRMIAERAEYTPTALYYHFADKASLLRELVDADFGALAADFQQIAGIADPMERLLATGRAYTAFALAHPNHYRLMFMSPSVGATCEPDAVHRGNPERDAYAFLVAVSRDVIATGRVLPQYREPHLLAQIAWAGLHGVIALHLDNGADAWVDWRPAAETAAAMGDVLLRGLVGNG